MKRTYKYRVYPTRDQQTWLYAEFKHQKRLYNYMLQMRSQMWDYGSKSVFLSDQQSHLTKLRENSHYGDHPVDMQQATLRRLDGAYDNFFTRCKTLKKKHKKGHPKFKSSVRSVTWALRKHRIKNKSTGTFERVRQTPIRQTGSRLDRLKVPKLGEVKIRMHRPLSGDPKEVTLKKTGRGWYCFIVCEVPDVPKCEVKSACGVDVGTKKFLVTSEGDKVGNRRFYKRGEKKLANLQRVVSRRQKGSKRYWKAKDALAKQHDKVACQRLDFIAKTAYGLFHHDGYDAIVAEDLHIKGMLKNEDQKGLSKSISDASWGMFFDWCKWVAKRDGKHFHAVDPAHTSKTCSNCCQRVKGKMSLSVRTYNCKHCQLSIDRDHNAALNILYRAACALRENEFWFTILVETRNPLLLQACWG